MEHARIKKSNSTLKERWQKRASLLKCAELSLEEIQASLQKQFGDVRIYDFNAESNYMGFFKTDEYEYRWILDEDSAYALAVEKVRDELEENPEYFDQEWLMAQVDYHEVESFFERIYNDLNELYADVIESEDASSEEYENRLAEEMANAGVSTKEEFVEHMTQDNLDEGENGISHFRSEFGDKETTKIIKNNHLIDITMAANEAVDTDGWIHFMSSYDDKFNSTDEGVVFFIEGENYDKKHEKEQKEKEKEEKEMKDLEDEWSREGSLISKLKVNAEERYMSDDDIASRYEGYRIYNFVVNPSLRSGWFTLDFPNNKESMTENWILYDNGKIAFNNWYPEKMYFELVDYIKAHISETAEEEIRELEDEWSRESEIRMKDKMRIAIA